ncbi:hypothetical protein PR003_g7845 [Phytophthora rubi]|uniref:Uncharacterized protein n=1 Tax=Phytophthora rubi TaxID=129364 RepID=A0A6A4FCU6_9STRA|nr:hypothetical protein PR002_g10214 [Phytophthora rubi]KAE9033503.1 hypothetical protein PR001_g10136 [Phytophthora rubi]KAE9345646.1 hypothetical protein PR003_g7845 [Phytophthora rubi]
MALTTPKFKQDNTRHLKEGERYELRTILAHVQAFDTRVREMEARMASIEELLRARPASQDRQESVTETIDASSLRDDESSSDEDADV